jgi:hypothetical protein
VFAPLGVSYVYAKADGLRNAYPISKINARPG